MFAPDFCECCYQSHMGSPKEYQSAANLKSPAQIKTSAYQKSQTQVQFECHFET